MSQIGKISLPLIESTDQTDQNLPRFIVHEIVSGDNMWDISRKHGLSYNDFLELNLRYNSAELLRHNPELPEQITDQNGENLHLVKIDLRPGQMVLIPESAEQCYSRFSPSDGVVREFAECFLGDEKPHRDAVYAYADKTHGMDHYAAGQSSGDNDATAHQNANDIRFSMVESLAYSQLVERIEKEVREMDCELSDVECYRKRHSLGTVADLRRKWISQNIFTYDKSGDGWFSPEEYSKAVTECEKAHPEPKK